MKTLLLLISIIVLSIQPSIAQSQLKLPAEIQINWSGYEDEDSFVRIWGWSADGTKLAYSIDSEGSGLPFIDFSIRDLRTDKELFTLYDHDGLVMITDNLVEYEKTDPTNCKPMYCDPSYADMYNFNRTEILNALTKYGIERTYQKAEFFPIPSYLNGVKYSASNIKNCDAYEYDVFDFEWLLKAGDYSTIKRYRGDCGYQKARGYFLNPQKDRMAMLLSIQIGWGTYYEIAPSLNLTFSQPNTKLAIPPQIDLPNVKIWGWSASNTAGLVAYSQENGEQIDFVIFDMIHDKALFAIQIDSYEANKTIILRELFKYQIERVENQFLTFPQVINKATYDAKLDIKYNNELITEYEVTISRDSKAKSIGKFTANEPVTNVSVAGILLSPFENRALVVIAEQDGEIIRYRFSGCHLGVGFRLL
ncbi:MAG: hypothetical protein LBV04_05140 [Deferribacteraceae bacterium]|jgi:hypothetical protein|nr:hypothetical protein [Deferribacteraceae bacterium]